MDGEYEEADQQAVDQIRSAVVSLLRQYHAESELDVVTINYACLVGLMEFLEDPDLTFSCDLPPDALE